MCIRDRLEILQDSRLFLCIFGIDKSESEESANLHDWCEKISDQIFNSDFTEVLTDFNEKLNKVGYYEEQDYSQENWDIKEITYYEVKKDFPKLVSSEISPAIANVNYSIYMNQLKPFQIEKEDLIDFLNDSNS